jgi:hypothetical protein
MKTHPMNVSALVVGLVFLGLAGSWGLREAGAIDYGDAAWLLPVLLVTAGTIGFVAAVTKSSRADKRDNDHYDTTYGEL